MPSVQTFHLTFLHGFRLDSHIYTIKIYLNRLLNVHNSNIAWQLILQASVFVDSAKFRALRSVVLNAAEIQRTEYRCSKGAKKQRLKSNWWFILKKNTNEQKGEIVPGSKTGYVNCEVPSLLMCGLGVWEWTYLCVCYCFGFFFLSVCCIDYFTLDFFSNLFLFVLVIQWRICLGLLIRRTWSDIHDHLSSIFSLYICWLFLKQCLVSLAAVFSLVTQRSSLLCGEERWVTRLKKVAWETKQSSSSWFETACGGLFYRSLDYNILPCSESSRLSATVVICGRTPEHPMFRYSLFGILKKKWVIVLRTFLTFSQIQVGHSRFDRSLLMNYPLFSFHCKLTSVLFKIKFLLNLFIVKYCLQPAYNETLFPALECQRISRKWNICAAREQQSEDSRAFCEGT